METKIRNDYKQSIINKDVDSKLTLSLLINKIDKLKKEVNRDVSDDEILALVMKDIKKRNQSIDAYEKASRKDLLDKENRELVILTSYTPEPLSEESILSLIREQINNNPGIHEGKLFGLINKACKGLNKADQIKQLIAQSK